MDDRQVVIIGGGVAGISAAVHAIENGWQPLVLEATPHPGGR
ncbi:MAG: FAD-dependent oxidoreductase, partial [Calditrichia bacterium]